VDYVSTDQLNTPRVITDSSQTVLWTWNSDPFGNGQPTGSLSYNLRFPGQYYDAETGHNYNYLRDYDPTTGRYAESDPIGLNGGINEYRYAYANPVIYLDPMGTCTQIFCIGTYSDSLKSTLVDPGRWALINVHEEPDQLPQGGGLLRDTGLSQASGMAVAVCFFSKTRTYRDEYTRTFTGHCLERCADCGGNSHLQWTSYTKVENFSEERREREQQIAHVSAYVPFLRCLELLSGLH
jgi:RHS repeat-associated protein